MGKEEDKEAAWVKPGCTKSDWGEQGCLGVCGVSVISWGIWVYFFMWERDVEEDVLEILLEWEKIVLERRDIYMNF